MKKNCYFNMGIKHDFPFINNGWVLREVLKMEDVARGFQHFPRDLVNVNECQNRYYCINSAQTKEIMVPYILQPHHIFICVKAFILMLVPGGLQHMLCWRQVMSISKGVLTAHAHMNCHINTQLFLC